MKMHQAFISNHVQFVLFCSIDGVDKFLRQVTVSYGYSSLFRFHLWQNSSRRVTRFNVSDDITNEFRDASTVVL
jgi:hypothetical protein